VGCEGSDAVKDNEPNLRTLSYSETQVSSASNDFAFNLFKKIQDEKPVNNFVSPFSVGTALAMTLNGADGETQQSILNTINFGDLSASELNQGYKDINGLLLSMDNTVEFGIANSVWYDNKYHVQTAFSNIIHDFYDGTTQGLDFKQKDNSKKVINNWVEQKTNNRITDLIEDIEDNQAMFIVNAIYFKGDWTYQFDKSRTHDAPFFTPFKQTSAKLMYSEGVNMNVYTNDQFQLIDIPSGNEQFSLTILMPHQPENLTGLIATLNAQDFSYWLSQTIAATYELELPKFKMKWKKDLKETLMGMGMKMSGFPKLFQENLDLEISAVLHQSFIEVNETGAEAAAATAVSIVELSLAPPPSKITVDKSFIFMIREKHSAAILFIGQLIDPADL
jgi:serpin B